MDLPNELEREAQLRIIPAIEPLLALSRITDATIKLVAEALYADPQVGAAINVARILMYRLAGDGRVCALSASCGYGLQACATAATIMEIVGSLSFVGQSEERALAWVDHNDKTKSYPRSIRQGIDATLTALSIPDPPARDDWYQQYSFLCMAKHANPVLSLKQGMQQRSTNWVFIGGPDSTPIGIFLAAEAVNTAIGLSSAGIMVAARHCIAPGISADLQAKATGIRDNLVLLTPLFDELAAKMRAT
jgi:hypothetical protein